MQIQDPSEIGIADIHRFPQRPVYCNKKRKCKPIIVRLTSATDKSKIFHLAKNLGEYNDSNSEASRSSGSQFRDAEAAIFELLSLPPLARPLRPFPLEPLDDVIFA